VQNQQGSDSEDEDAEDEKHAAEMLSLGAPDPAAYKSKSGGIVDVLNDMKEKAEGELSEARKAENNLKHNYDMLKVSLVDSIKAATHEMDEAKKDTAEAEETKSVAEGELVVTDKDLAVAKEALDLTHEDCMQKATDHELTVKGRKEELAALGKAKKILQQMAAKGFLQTNPSFLQTAATTRLRTSKDLAELEVVNLVKKLAKEQRSGALAQLASRIATTMKYAHSSGDDPFAKIKTLINEMIAKLMKEAEAEASEKAYCDEEMGKTKAKKGELSDDIEKATTKIDKFTTDSIALKEDVKELQKELAELADAQAEMDKIREETHEAYVAAKKDLENGLEAIRQALEVLRDYYGSKESLIQGDLGSYMQQPAAPAKHEKSAGAGGAIISMLEVAESDFANNLAEEESEEAAAQEEYDKVTQENKVTKMTKEQDVKYKTKEFTALDKEVAELTADREGAQTELDAVLEYYEKIKDRCVAKPDPYEERKKRREAEIAGLKEALSILEGQAFLQRRTSLRHVRRTH